MRAAEEALPTPLPAGERSTSTAPLPRFLAAKCN
ncbi:hypothetical protein H4W32_003760 [Actinophytocola algeriensis]|uniref:Uncharacterized protein n=1 Tax=Actinophytocola algeriensis TaxID=1768010 RepID=A0A7W7QA76_9PSEU|nr:hypothetical protein [Actinophytocola algeriensis]MBE1475718.1 hypothetical protein [Actinophytocola algeriensis]